MVVLDLIEGAVRTIGSISVGETLDADEANNGLALLNEMLETLSLSTVGVYNQPPQTFNLVAAQSTYTIGSGGNFNTTAPINILDAYTIYNNVSRPIEIIDQAKYDSILYKTQSTTYPIYLMHQNTVPLGNIILWPYPAASMQIVINATAQFAPYATLADTVTLPSGAKRMLRLLLAMELADDYGAPIDPKLERKAAQAKAAYMRSNARPQASMQYDASLSGSFGRPSYSDFIAGNY